MLWLCEFLLIKQSGVKDCNWNPKRSLMLCEAINLLLWRLWQTWRTLMSDSKSVRWLGTQWISFCVILPCIILTVNLWSSQITCPMRFLSDNVTCKLRKLLKQTCCTIFLTTGIWRLAFSQSSWHFTKVGTSLEDGSHPVREIATSQFTEIMKLMIFVLTQDI